MLFVMFFIARNLVFSARISYKPLDFTVTARYVQPLKIEFDEDVMKLGTFLENESLNTLNKSFGITINGEPLDIITISVDPTITLKNIPKNKNITINQSLADTMLRIPASGTITTTIAFTSNDTVPNSGDGTYIGETTITATVN